MAAIFVQTHWIWTSWDIGIVLFDCWTNIYDAGPTIGQYND